MAHYVICDNKCLEEAYSKQEVDNLVSFIEVTGEIVVTSSGTGVKDVTIPYPEGFNKDNTYVMSEWYRTSATGSKNFYSNMNDGLGLSVTTADNYILVRLARYEDNYAVAAGTYYVGMLLQKID